MKAIFSLSIMVAAVALLAFSVPIHAARIDTRIEDSARQSYVFKTYLKDDDIKIRSRDGAVTLTGSVSEYFHKSLAHETVIDLPDVKSVDNKLEVKAVPPSANSDAWLREKVKVSLLFHRSVSSVVTVVIVKDGIVTLRGDAASLAQKELSTEYAQDVDGVRNVSNEMTVSASKKSPRTVGEKIDDASITALVNITLLNHRSTSVLNTTVKTKRGLVTVRGSAKNLSEKGQVTKLVSDINGVKGVKNLMIIE